ncbi:DUF7689 domain-containing protein [Burkholderia gladioli]|uniref:DUF7689 domain-containing protein n=1 Tax=Burkholderia gladioli TaxID=28095 RepID=UPI003AFABD16
MLYTAAQLQQIYRIFPSIDKSTFVVTSPQTRRYNCIAWAAADNGHWWEPHPDYYWPPGLPLNDYSVANYIAAFRTIGYTPCVDGSLEVGVEKVVIYSAAGIAKHMARQLPDGAWTSKLGQGHDVRHGNDRCLAGQTYGICTHYLSRPLNHAAGSV